MTLGLSLNNALSGLKANQQAISVLSHNISNANTDGYSRQVLEQSALYVNGVGSGVRIDDIVRKVDKYLQRAVQTQGSAVGRTEVVNQYFERINVLLGAPGGTTTLDEYVTGFFNAAQTLSETPDRTSARSNLISAATALSSNISNTAYDLTDLRFEADREMRTAVEAVNGLITKLNNLNIALGNSGALGNPQSGLLDERDMALREMASYLDISTSFREDGSVSVITGDGVSIVDGNLRQLRYNPATSINQFVSDTAMQPLQVVQIDPVTGAQIGAAVDLITGGTTGNITSKLTGGKIEGLRMMRDDVIPSMLAQMDQLAANLRDAVNTIHNDGSGFPAATQLTGTRSVAASQATSWSGLVRIAVLNKDGSPVPANYADENYTGLRPLTLNLAQLTDGFVGSVTGRPSLQTIVDEINNHFASPDYKSGIGNLNSVRLVSDTDALPMGVATNSFQFDFDLENISGEDNVPFFVTGITVQNDLGANITSINQGAPTIALDPAGAYTTTNLTSDVVLNLTATPEVQVGDRIYLGAPGAPTVNGIPAAALTGYFVVQAVNGNTVTITAGAAATSSGTVPDGSGVSIMEPYQMVDGGDITRARENGLLDVNLSASPSSTYYDITVAVATFDENGNLLTSNMTYRVRNGQQALMNDRYDAIAVTADGVRTQPQTTQAAMRAILVDENGQELLKVNGRYIDREPSYLKLLTDNSEYTIAIDELDSRQLGDQSVDPAVPGTNWGFSHYFGLNDFFVPNQLTATGDTVKNSAYHLQVAQRLIDDPNLITTGELVLQRQPADATADPQYTYVRYAGDNQLATRLKALSAENLNFAAAGGLPSIGLTLSGYTSEMLGYIASLSAGATDDYTSAQTLYDGFKTRSDAITGVNLDEELANTVIFQNSYSASARIVTVVNQLFEDLLGMV